MVKLTYTASDPEAMVVKFSDTSAALVAMATPVRLLNATDIAESFWWHLHGLDMT